MRKIASIFLLTLSLNAFAQSSPYEGVGQALGSLIGVIVESLSRPKDSVQIEPSPPMQNSSSNTEVDPFWRLEASRIKRELCSEPDFSGFFKKTPCDIANMQTKNLSDPSLITTVEAKYLPLISVMYQRIADLESTAYIANFKPADKGLRLSSIRLKEFDKLSDLLQKLDEKKITWGQFNTQRVQLDDAVITQYVELLR